MRSTFHPEGYQSAITNFLRSFTNYRSEPLTPATMTSSCEGEGGDGLRWQCLRNILKVSHLTGTGREMQPAERSVLGITAIWFSYLCSLQERGTASCIKDLHVNPQPPFQGREGWSQDTVARLWFLAFQPRKQIHHRPSASPASDGPSITGEALPRPHSGACGRLASAEPEMPTVRTSQGNLECSLHRP